MALERILNVPALIAYAITHPKQALEVKARQILVSCDLGHPPHTSPIEEFASLPVNKAAEAIRQARQETT